MLSSTGFVIALSSIITILLARALTPSELGIILAAEAYIELFNFFFRTGFRNSLLKFSATDPNGFKAGLNKAFANAFLVKSITVIPGILLAYFISQFFQQGTLLKQIINIYIAIFTIDSFATIFAITRRALGQFKLMSIMDAVDKILRLFVIYFVLIHLKAGIMTLVWAFLIEKVIKFSISALTTIRLVKPQFDLRQIGFMLKDSCSFGLIDTLENAPSRIDRVMLNSMLGASSLAYFAVPAKLNKVSQVFSKAIANVFLPSMHENIISNHEQFKKTTHHLSRFLAFLGICVFIFVFYYAENILLWLFGETYSESIQVVKLFAFINLFWYLENTSQLTLMAQSAHKLRFSIWITNIILGIILNYFLIKAYGLIGLVYSNIISSALRLFMASYYTRYYIAIRESVLIIFLPLLLIYFVPLHYLLTLFIIYIYLAKIIRAQDIDIIRKSLFRSKQKLKDQK